MKTNIIVAIFVILIWIMGMQNVTANCAGDYEGGYHSLFLADVDHSCPNPYTYAEYNLYGDGSGDFDLYVLDTWNNTWYKSTSSANNEYIKVPIHCGYPHKAYVWNYRGSGSWSVCSPQVYFGEGFRQIADSESAPDISISIPATTGGIEEPGIVGRWQLTYDWDCDGSSSETELIFFSDGTFGDDGDLNEGVWSNSGQSIRWRHDESPNALYSGSMYGVYMSGTMSTNDGSDGCWTASKIS
jgi:hypothetical protein